MQLIIKTKKTNLWYSFHVSSMKLKEINKKIDEKPELKVIHNQIFFYKTIWKQKYTISLFQKKM